MSEVPLYASDDPLGVWYQSVNFGASINFVTKKSPVSPDSRGRIDCIHTFVDTNTAVFQVWSSGFGGRGFGVWVSGLEFEVLGFGYGIWDFGFGFGVLGLRFGD